MEIVINVIGYAGFIAVATYHRSPDENFPEWKIRGSLGAELLGVQSACGTPAVRTSLSAVTSTWLLSACGRNEKLTTTKARQNSRPTIITRRWVGLSALWNEGTMACFPFGHPYRNSEYAQRDLGFNLTEQGYLRFREQIDPVRSRGARLLLFLQNEQGARFPAPLPC
jgi:hypothetical protein